MPPLFLVQEILDCDIPEEMKIYKEKTGRKVMKGYKDYDKSSLKVCIFCAETLKICASDIFCV